MSPSLARSQDVQEHMMKPLAFSFGPLDSLLAPTSSWDTNSLSTGLTVSNYLLQSVIHCNITSVVKVRAEHAC